VTLIVVIAGCFAIELALAEPQWRAVAAGLMPATDILANPDMLYLAVGILGATVMPHNLYLHSAIVQTRKFARSTAGRREAIRFATVDIVLALTFAIFVNAAILILAAAAFHHRGMTEVVSIEEAYRLLTPGLGVAAASTLFAMALLAAGHNSSITGTLAGQVVMEGFTGLRWPMWLRRLLARLLAMIPALIAVSAYGEDAATRLLIFSQVVLSLQLPFAIWPLVRFTNDRALMGRFANRRATALAAWLLAALLTGFNVLLLVDMMAG
jgi:manganese transport protein